MDRYTLTIDQTLGHRVAGLRRAWRALAALAVAISLFALVGDGGVRSATATGWDPLDLLNLQAKANAFIILDTSGSMGDSITATTSGMNQTGDIQPVNKLNTAKTVLQNVIAANQTTVAFSFGTYNQGTTSLTTGGNRFAYYTTSTDSPGMLTHEIIATAHTTTPVMPVHRTNSGDFVDTSGVTQYELIADSFVNGKAYTVYSNGTVCAATAVAATNPPQVTITMVNSTTNCAAATLTTAVFKWAGAYESAWGTPSTSCSGYLNRVALAPCSQTDQLVAGGIGNYLRPSLLLDTATGTTIQGYTENASGGITSQPTLGGLRSGGYTPIANSLLDLRAIWDSLWTGTISPEITAGSGVQSTFAIVVTDGADTCANRTSGGSESDGNALRGAYAAQQLYAAHDDGSHSYTRFKTFVVYIGPTNPTELNRASWVAWAGTGLGTSPNPTIGASGSGEARAWSAAPTTAQRNACSSCVDAFSATNLDELTAALQAAINLGQTGAFADRAVISQVYEYGSTPLDPTTWSQQATMVEYQTTWDIPGFLGHLRAYVNQSDAALQQWDAGAQLMARVTITASPGATFAQLHGGATDANVGGSSAMIKRRIYTTSGNGNNGNYAPANILGDQATMRVALWPPASGIDPASGAGTFDTELGLMAYTTPASLQTSFGACLGTPLPAGCSGTTAQQVDQGRKEAREMILAYMAGARVLTTSGLTPTRDAAGNVLYVARSWILAESTNGAPAVATAPPDAKQSGAPLSYATEWGLLRDGAGSGNNVTAGFGLRSGALMTVVFLPANDMLHAFRAGPCPSGCSEIGGEELWGFVPYDQLGKLTARLLTPSQSTTDHSNHIYMMAAPVRLAHAFIPVTPFGTSWSTTVGGAAESLTGVWRTVLLAGRGAGGKYLTALDVTGPGSMTTASLSTTPPIVMWNRTYSGMGETWSVPAVLPVDPAVNLDLVTRDKVPFVAYVGSGYSDVSTEGTTFYALNVANGNLIKGSGSGGGVAYDVGLNGGSYNAILAGPSGYQPNLLSYNGFKVLGPTDTATLVYFPDIQGRVFSFDAQHPETAPVAIKNYGGTQPFGVPLMLLSTPTSSNAFKPHVYGVTGADTRVAADHAFLMVGLNNNTTPAVADFEINFPSGFRGTVQPVGTYDDSTPPDSIALFIGTKYTPATTQCVSGFDSVLYIVESLTGAAAYDLPDNGGRSIDIPHQKVTDLGMAGGQARLGGGVHPETFIPPPTTSGSRVNASVSVGPPAGGKAYPGTASFKIGSSVSMSCR